jgi:DNA-binding IclR family transcriptional regulator
MFGCTWWNSEMRHVTAARGRKKPTGAQSIERAILVLRAVAAATVDGSTLSRVVAASRLTKATVHRILSVLVREGLVGRDEESKTYFLGEEIYALGTLAAPRFGLHQLALPALHRLATMSQDSAFLLLIAGNDVVCVHREEGTHPIRTHVLQAGKRFPLGVGSFGVAILAAMDDSDVERVMAVNDKRAIAEGYRQFTADRLWQFIRTARAKGYFVNPGLVFPEAWGIAVAVLDGRGQPIGALNIGAIASRMQEDRQPSLAAALKAEAAVLSKQLSNWRSNLAA